MALTITLTSSEAVDLLMLVEVAYPKVSLPNVQQQLLELVYPEAY